MPRVTVLLPVSTDAAGLPLAAADILHQSHTDLSLLIVLNGADGPTEEVAEALRRSDSRVTVETLPTRGLTAALNHGLRAASTEFVARMDSDDRCPKDRLALQLMAMQADPTPDAVGSAWRMEDQCGSCIALMRPPLSTLASWWELFAHNPFAHGSMMFRRSRVLDAGGYDPTLARAQDYDLWLRIATQGGLCALRDTLYTHRVRPSEGYHSSPLQAACAGRAFAAARARLADSSPLADAVRSELDQGPPSKDRAFSLLRQLQSETPTAVGIDAAARLRSLCGPPTSRPLTPSAILERLCELRSEGIDRVWLFGAGAGAERLVPLLAQSGISLAGLVDDSLAGTTRLDRLVADPSELLSGEHVVIASEAHEEAIWRSAAPQRARGVLVHRLSGRQAGDS